MDNTTIPQCSIRGHICYYTQRVYFSDTDAGGIVYHSTYLDITEHARTELLRLLGQELGTELREERVGFVVKSISLDYHRPALLDDLLVVETIIKKCERFSLLLEQRVKRSDTLLVTQITKVGYMRHDTLKPLPIPEALRASFLNVMAD